MHELTVTDIRSIFINELANKRFTIDKTGAKTIEMIGASFIATEPSIFGTVNEEYVRKEIDWYLGLSTNINDIYGDVLESGKEPPKAWQYTANDHGEINSNYGYLIYADKYFRQYESALIELENNPDSRRATMIYQRPSIQVEFQENGKNDFICTNAVTYYIRDEKLSCVVQMRSNDVVYGYKNDYAWQQFVLNTLAQDLNVDTGDIMWQVQNLHVYEKHFDLVK
jgi:thymidylate synthase|tara:strand:+ start:1855 stop:2529 length:675 start_codon:yes stop_codon:yes gene_type:complete